ncbi:MAG: dethiobiotin synthase [Pedobacter sp.]|nr:MAG: dethiobiotin synthase [Pedobacter sp.]
MKSHKYFITGIGTGVGKTLIATILTEFLQADYWKPIQSGDLHNSDSRFITKHLSNNKSKIHPETYKLNTPLSPHASAKLDNIYIEMNAIQLPATTNHLIVEGAGGLFVPLNQEYFIIDLIKKLDIPVILVCQNYLGSINHSILSIEALNKFHIQIAGIIFNGESNPESEIIITQHAKAPIIGHIPILPSITKQTIQEAGKHINWKL